MALNKNHEFPDGVEASYWRITRWQPNAVDHSVWCSVVCYKDGDARDAGKGPLDNRDQWFVMTVPEETTLESIGRPELYTHAKANVPFFAGATDA